MHTLLLSDSPRYRKSSVHMRFASKTVDRAIITSHMDRHWQKEPHPYINYGGLCSNCIGAIALINMQISPAHLSFMAKPRLLRTPSSGKYLHDRAPLLRETNFYLVSYIFANSPKRVLSIWWSGFLEEYLPFFSFLLFPFLFLFSQSFLLRFRCLS